METFPISQGMNQGARKQTRRPKKPYERSSTIGESPYEYNRDSEKNILVFSQLNEVKSRKKISVQREDAIKPGSRRRRIENRGELKRREEEEPQIKAI